MHFLPKVLNVQSGRVVRALSKNPYFIKGPGFESTKWYLQVLLNGYSQTGHSPTLQQPKEAIRLQVCWSIELLADSFSLFIIYRLFSSQTRGYNRAIQYSDQGQVELVKDWIKYFRWHIYGRGPGFLQIWDKLLQIGVWACKPCRLQTDSFKKLQIFRSKYLTKNSVDCRFQGKCWINSSNWDMCGHLIF